MKEEDMCDVWGCMQKTTEKYVIQSIIYKYCDKHYKEYKKFWGGEK